MNDEKEDQRWLDALSGEIVENKAGLSKDELEANAIRHALLKNMQMRETFETTEADFKRLIEEANKRGLMKAEKVGGFNDFLRSIYDFLSAPAAVMASVTLVFGLSVTVGWQAHEMNSSEEMAVRGGASVERISLIVPSPKDAAQGWQKDLLAAGIEHTVSFEQPSRILIRMKLTPNAIRLLEEGKRIQPPARDWITLVIEAANVVTQ